MRTTDSQPFIAIACGGTGGHLFPGLAVGEVLVARGCRVALLISPKDVDQRAVKGVTGMEIVTLPAVASTAGLVSFARGFRTSYTKAKKFFAPAPPQAVLGMGGFISAPPVLAGKLLGAKTFLHESNTIPGRANRWLARVVDEAFVFFPQAAARLRCRRCAPVGMPVRPQFQPGEPAAARLALGLDPHRPVLLIMGGSQGATGVNELVLHALPKLHAAMPDLQFIHLTGAGDHARVEAAYAAAQLAAVVRPFVADMEVVMAAATAAVSRAGASSLAETAAMRLPSILVPYPAAADDHQRFNARAFVGSGAALLLEQSGANSSKFAALVLELVSDSAKRAEMKTALGVWHVTGGAEKIAVRILDAIGVPVGARVLTAAAEAAAPARELRPAKRPEPSLPPGFELPVPDLKS
ncbi:MAG: UDP-N-acetylglucosamine--N-acetylmuramyl-(pentapeptide) pyrophosphoryl-undecaprenol N-acetylglucosamine transferase [Verrucomicrobia bacterium]|nr:UDP-N-acetylglucosamine--N-acetylmuramyl-(pentapeptide) pyrophosphoryl-undecaprenol N-acetylglucosamine transferase [Verrucomicrobiota bacterium]